MAERRILFVAGIGRSGTTAFTELLDAHPGLAVGMERFKYLWDKRLDEVTPALFERDRFFDFTDGLTNITPREQRWRPLYTALEAKWETADYVGDKMTQVYPRRLWQTCPGSTYVAIVRDPAEVAASWDVRATTATDAWPGHHHANKSVGYANQAFRRILQAKRARPRRLAVVTHRELFGDPEARQLAALLRFLELPPSADLDAAFAAAHREYVERVADKPRDLTPDQRAFLDQHLDDDAWAAVQRLAL